jgi:hypothetical protein
MEQIQAQAQLQLQDVSLEHHIFFVPIYCYTGNPQYLDKDMISHIPMLCVTNHFNEYILLNIENFQKECIHDDYKNLVIHLDNVMEDQNMFVKLTPTSTQKFMDNHSEIPNMLTHFRKHSSLYAEQIITKLFRMERIKNTLNQLLNYQKSREGDIT